MYWTKTYLDIINNKSVITTTMEISMNILKELMKEKHIFDAHTVWESYRKTLTNFLISNTSANANVAILGAGYSNDMDLSLLSNHYSDITLFDMNYHALQESLITYNLDKDESITIKKVDFLGLKLEDYDEFAKLVVKNIVLPVQANYKPILEQLEKFHQKIIKSKISIPKSASYDYVISIGVHSELVSYLEQIIEQACIQKGIQKEASINAKLTQINSSAAVKLNEQIFTLANISSFIGVKTAINQSEQLINGAYQAHNHIVKAIQSGRFANLNYIDLTWVYDSEQTYRMSIIKLGETL
jgi:hypothetical protein